MLYIVVDKLGERTPLAIKAVDEETFQDMLKLSDTQKIVGRITNEELNVLSSSGFAVIQA